MLRALVLASLLPLLAGCASDPLQQVREEYSAGNYQAAHDDLVTLKNQGGDDAALYALELSVVDLALRKPHDAEEVLRFARDRLDQVREAGAFDWLASVLLDDRQLPFLAADYEQVLVRAMLAVANLMGSGGDAAAYALQVLEEQTRLMQSFEANGNKPKMNYKLVAFGTYLRAILAEEDPTRLDVARRAYQQVLEMDPGLQLAEAGVQRVTEGVHSPKGHGAVHVLALVGRGPYRVSVDEPVTRNVLAIVQWIWAAERKRVTLPNIAAVPVPELAYHKDNPTAAQVIVDGKPMGTTETVTDVEAIASQEWAVMKDYYVARAALRRAFKIVVTEGLKEAVNPERKGQQANPWVDLAISVGGLLWSAAEQADLRAWGLLPAEFQAQRLVLPVGVHDITLVATRNGVAVGQPQTVTVEVHDGLNTYVVGLLPTTAGGPQPMTSDSPQIGAPPQVQPATRP